MDSNLAARCEFEIWALLFATVSNGPVVERNRQFETDYNVLVTTY